MRARPKTTPAIDAVLDGLVGHIDKCLDAYEDFGRRTRWEAQPGAPVEYETGRLRRQMGPGRLWDGTEANRAAVITTLFTQQAAEHLEAVQSLIKARQVTFSVAPLTRSIVELCGHVYWLLEGVAPLGSSWRNSTMRPSGRQRQRLSNTPTRNRL